MNAKNAISSLLGILFLGFLARAQEVDSTSVDPLDHNYLEDQFYIGLGYNLLLDKPTAFSQRNLSYSLQLGLIKDIPLNPRRNFGLGVGIGYAVNSYYSNMKALDGAGAVGYRILEESEFKRSKFETHALEFPLELRWRTSTAADYKFWRIYGGAKLSYVFSGRSRMALEEGRQGFANADIEKVQYGLMLNFGYNTWNIHFYYGLNPLLKDGKRLDTGEPLELKVLRVGVIFYIL